ncbi:MAG: dihydrodipicolinate reductase [Clostridia bacterium]
MKKVKVVQFGCGNMSKYTMRYVIEKGGEIVGAFDRDLSKCGKDIGDIANIAKQGILIQDNTKLDKFLKTHKVDIVIVTTRSLISEIEEVLTICAKNGVNAVTICEEAFFPQNSNPKVFKKIDRLARENDCTITGTGYQDVFWGNLIMVLAGATQSIKKIKGQSSYNVEDYGVALAEVHGAGLNLKRFENEIAAADNISAEARAELIKKGTFLPSYMWNVNGWMCSCLGLTITSQVQKCIPQIAKKDIYSKTLDMKIPKGYATGMSAVVTTNTKEGIILETECIGKVYDDTEFDCNNWTIEGEPSTQVIINRPSTVELTCATVVNRITDIITAPAGYVTTEKLAPNYFKSKLEL